MKEEILFNNPTLCNTPIVRNGKQATVGFEPETWKAWE
jgi:arsenate reductase-like glutaredoxin family protein